MRRDVADGCGANKMWISGEPGRVSSGSCKLRANLGEERRALVVDQSARQPAALVLGRSSSALRHTLGGRRRRSGSGHWWLGKAALGPAKDLPGGDGLTLVEEELLRTGDRRQRRACCSSRQR
jgi:hypothetical protein